AAPWRLGPVLRLFLMKGQTPAGKLAVAPADHSVAVIFGNALADVPPDDRVVEGLGCLRIGSHQLVQDEVSAGALSRLLRGRVYVANVSHGSISLVRNDQS